MTPIPPRRKLAEPDFRLSEQRERDGGGSTGFACGGGDASPYERRSLMAIAVVATWLLYLSGIFVLWTPLPLLLRYGREGAAGFNLTAVISFAGILCLYALLLKDGNGGNTGWQSFVTFPGYGFRDYFEPQFVLAFALLYFFYYVAIAGVLGWAHGARLPVIRTFSLAVLGPLIISIIVIHVVASSQDLSLGVEIRGYIGHVLDRIAALGSTAGISGQEQNFLRTHRDDIANQIVRMLPAGMVIASMVTVWCNVMAARLWFPRGGLFAHFGALSRFRLEERWIWILIGAGVVYFLDYYVIKSGLSGTIALNVLWVGAAVYFLQGLAIVSYFLQRRSSLFLKGAVYSLLILFFQVFAIFVAALGIFDMWFDFRKLTKTVA